MELSTNLPAPGLHSNPKAKRKENPQMLPSARPHCRDTVPTPTHKSPISRMLLRYRW